MLGTYTYLSYDDFGKKYKDDLKEWLIHYPNGTELLYLEELEKDYSFYIENEEVNLVDVKIIPIYPTLNESSDFYNWISLNELALILEERINYVLNNNIQIFNEMIEEKAEYEDQNPFKNPTLFIYNDKFDINDDFDSDDRLDLNTVIFYAPLFNFKDKDAYGYKKKLCHISINDLKVKDFELTIKQILKAIKERKEELENKDTCNDDLPKSTAKQKIIYLNELGIIDLLRTKEPFSHSPSRLAPVLETILEEKPGTLQPYINALISKNLISTNYPYDLESNIEKVNKALEKVGFKKN